MVLLPSQMDHKMGLLLMALQEFYDEEDTRMDTLMSVLGRDSTVSLRMLDWLVTNYARKVNIHYDERGGQNFNVFLSYKTQLRAYSKRRFDPFKRRERVRFCAKGQTLVTTVAQLNFFRWAIEHGVVDYAKKHLRDIEADMLGTVKRAAPAEAPAAKRRKPQRGFDQKLMIRQGNIRIAFQ